MKRPILKRGPDELEDCSREEISNMELQSYIHIYIYILKKKRPFFKRGQLNPHIKLIANPCEN